MIYRENNIFKDEKSAIYQKKHGEVWVTYPEISGTRDSVFENLVNKAIKKSITEFLADAELDKMMPSKTRTGEIEPIARIGIGVCFNSYGILSFERNIWSTGNRFENYDKIYSFDVIKKKPVDIKEMLNSFAKKDNEMKERFTNLTEEAVIKQFLNKGKSVTDGIVKKVNYNYIMKNSEIYFFREVGEVKIRIVFSENSSKDLVKGTNYKIGCDIPLKSVINTAYEDFFGW